MRQSLIKKATFDVQRESEVVSAVGLMRNHLTIVSYFLRQRVIASSRHRRRRHHRRRPHQQPDSLCFISSGCLRCGQTIIIKLC